MVKHGWSKHRLVEVGGGGGEDEEEEDEEEGEEDEKDDDEIPDSMGISKQVERQS